MSDSASFADGDPQPITEQQALDVLAQGEVKEEHGLMPWGSNYSYLVSVTKEDISLLAVYKPQRGERPLWDFPDGTLCHREVATYLVSAALGWNLVPPTVLRAGPYGLGSVQMFIDHDPEMNYFTPFPARCRDQLVQFAAFDYIINNADRKGGHCLLDSQGRLWGIDHGIAFHYAPKLRTVIWDFAGQRVPDTLKDNLSQLCQQLEPETGLRAGLTQLLNEREIAAFSKRVHRLIDRGRFPGTRAGAKLPLAAGLRYDLVVRD